MKSFIMVLWLTLIASSICSSQEQAIKLLNIRNSQIVTILNEVILHEKTDSIRNELYVVKIKKHETHYQFRIASFSKKVFSSFFVDKKEPLLGYFKHRGYSVLVFSPSIPAFFSENENGKMFEFLKNGTLSFKKEDDRLFPPDVIEPTVWIYNFMNEKMILKEAGYFNLLN